MEKELLETVFCVVVVKNGATIYICRNEEIAHNKLREYALTYCMEESDLEIVEEEFYE